MGFEYRVSVVVPVYNVAGWLKGCLVSLLVQTMPLNDMEVLLVDDGSTDDSPNICEAFAELYPGTVKVWHKANEGLGPTRNFGIEHAKGKYIMFLDSDDQLAPETVKACADFFDAHYDEIDLVSYKDQPYRQGAKLAQHFRYRYLARTGVYDLNDYPYITQTRVNVCVKNLGAGTRRFEMVDLHEDQEYCTRLLLPKMKIGYVANGEYRYNKDNDSSIMALRFDPIHLFEPTMRWFESLFAEFPRAVPPYIQALFVHDCSWKMQENILFPYHYDPERFEQAMARMRRLWGRVDVKTLLAYPLRNTFHSHFWLGMMGNADLALMTKRGAVAALSGGEVVYARRGMELILTRCEARGGELDFVAYLKSPVFSWYPGEPAIDVLERGDGEETGAAEAAATAVAAATRVPMRTNLAAESLYHCRTQTSRFFQFRYRRRIDRAFSFKVVVGLDGFEHATDYWFAPSVAFNIGLKRFSVVSGGVAISFERGAFHVRPQGVEGAPEPASARPEVWLYSDAAYIPADNALYQFRHDCPKEDGVERYYVTSAPPDAWGGLFDERELPWVVARGSERHKELYVAADKVLTSFVNNRDGIAASPFDRAEETALQDKIHAEVVYLQHGVLHASYEQQYSLECGVAHKIVVSSPFEERNFTGKYHYAPNDLIACGMPRYDILRREAAPQKKILLAPSWRSYFAARRDGAWALNEGKFAASRYAQGLWRFACSEALGDALRRHGYTLEIKLHPIAERAAGLFPPLPEGVRLAGGDANPEDYAVFVTDFSSYAFDFAFLGRAILYFVPDWEEFRCGIHAYRELDLPFEDAFGPLAKTPEDAARELTGILEAGAAPAPVYAERMRGFFHIEPGRCRERLYEALMAPRGMQKTQTAHLTQAAHAAQAEGGGANA